MRMTVPVRHVLRALLDATTEMYGLEVCDATGVDPGSIYPILGRLEEAGWVTSRWEAIDPAQEGRPRRRYWQITDQGRTAATARLACYPTSPRLTTVREDE